MTKELPHPQDFAAELSKELFTTIMSRPVTGARPRKAATLILIDRAGPTPRVLMGKRHEAHKFMPGKFVFPGGRIEPGDGRIASASELDPVTAEKLAACLRRPSKAGARAIALAAVRETFEETGLALGARENAGKPMPAGVWSDFASHGVTPSLEHIHFVGRAITPPRNKLRFDAHFLAADATAIAHRVDGVVSPNSELVELVWVPVREALNMGLVAITRVILRELENRVAQGFGRDLPVPFYQFTRTGWRRDEI